MTATNPTPGAYCPLNYDSSTSSLVLVNTGNFPAFTQNSVQTWSFTGSNWSLSDSTLSSNPSIRSECAAAWDGANLIAGFGKGPPSTGYYNDVWEMASNFAWIQTQPNYNSNGLVIDSTAGLTGRAKPYMATMTGGVVLHGGSTAYYLMNDTYFAASGSGGAFTQLFPASSPPVRDRAANASNGTTQFILFSGAGTNSLLLDSWVFNGTSWSSFSASNQPSARKGATLCWYSPNSCWILFGGSDSAGNPLQDTWQLNSSLTTWTKLSPNNSPSVREGASMAYSAATGLILWGGKNSARLLSDTFQWSGSNWVQL